MKVYIIEFKSDSEEARKFFPRLQVYETMEKAQQRMKVMHDVLAAEYPKAKHSCLESRSHVWADTEGFDQPLMWCIADIYIKEFEVH